MPTTHVLESTVDSVSAGTLDPSRPAALTIESGDVVSYPNTWTQWGNQARFGVSFADDKRVDQSHASIAARCPRRPTHIRSALNRVPWGELVPGVAHAGWRLAAGEPISQSAPPAR